MRNMHELPEKLPFIMIERPKMPRATWEALRTHIMRERQRKKQEQEQNQAFERQKKERENRLKQDAMTLEETKEQITKLEVQLNKYKEEKHQLFNTLKKVLYEDETRRRSREVPQPHLYLQSTRPGGSGHNPSNASLYMKTHSQILMPLSTPMASRITTPQTTVTLQQQPSQSATKRPKSPSPVRNASYLRQSSTQGLSPAKISPYPQSITSSVPAAHQASTSSYPATSMANHRPAHLPHHFAAYPSTAPATIHNPRVLEEERKKQQQQQQLQQQVYLLQHQRPHHPAISSAPPVSLSNSSAQQVFRSGSIISGYPRYNAVSSPSLPTTPVLPRPTQNSAPPSGRYYRD